MALDNDIDKFERLMNQFFQGLIKRKAVFAQEIDTEITDVQFMAGMVMMHNSSMNMSDLAACLGISLPTLTGIIERMVKRELVERSSDEKDRRIVKVKLTTKGTKIIKKSHDAKREHLRPMITLLDTDDRKTLLRILETLVSEIQKQHPKFGIQESEWVKK
jgi:MarR family transcriptional regulator, organic hydroperoxide resistance regulator